MNDTLRPAERSARMALIKSRDTALELRVRAALHSLGYRYRKNYEKLPGKPDLAFLAVRKVVFLNGCFWHGHGCRLDRRPRSRTSYWSQKLSRNQLRDVEVRKTLRRLGWGVLTVWECELRDFDRLLRRIERFLKD